jgi:hypothetical protein
MHQKNPVRFESVLNCAMSDLRLFFAQAKSFADLQFRVCETSYDLGRLFVVTQYQLGEQILLEAEK